MENADFKINITEKEGFDESGFDNAEFLISANRGEAEAFKQNCIRW